MWSIVLTWNTATTCQRMNKDWKQLLQCGKAIVSVTTWFEMQLNTKNTFYIKSTHLVHLVKRRLASVSPRRISLQENFSKALPLHIKEGSVQKQSLRCLELLFRDPAVFKGSVWFCVTCRRSAPTLILWSFTMTNLTIRCGCWAGETWSRTFLLSRWVHSSLLFHSNDVIPLQSFILVKYQHRCSRDSWHCQKCI